MPGQVDQVQAEAVRQVPGQRCEHAAVQRPAVDQDQVGAMAHGFDMHGAIVADGGTARAP